MVEIFFFVNTNNVIPQIGTSQKFLIEEYGTHTQKKSY